MRHLLWIVLVSACGGVSTPHSISVARDQVSADNHKCGAYAIRTGETTKDGEPITLMEFVQLYETDDARRIGLDKRGDIRVAPLQKYNSF